MVGFIFRLDRFDHRCRLFHHHLLDRSNGRLSLHRLLAHTVRKFLQFRRSCVGLPVATAALVRTGGLRAAATRHLAALLLALVNLLRCEIVPVTASKFLVNIGGARCAIVTVVSFLQHCIMCAVNCWLDLKVLAFE